MTPLAGWMADVTGKRRLKRILVLIAWLAGAGLAFLTLHAIRGMEGSDAVAGLASATAWPGGGRLWLQSVGLALTATAIAAVLAFPVGVRLGVKRSFLLGALVLVPLFVPAHVGAYVWRFTLEDLARALFGGALWRSRGWSFFGAAWTLAAIYWPVVALPIALAMRLRGRRLEEELATLAPPGPVFWRAVVPGLAPGWIAGAGLFFLLALSNYGVPLMWDVPSQNVAVFARLSAFYSTGQAILASAPLAATALMVCAAALIWLRRRPYDLDLGAMLEDRAEHRLASRRFRILAAVVLFVTVALPVAGVLANERNAAMLRVDLLAGGSAYSWGLALAALGACGAVAAGILLALFTRRARPPARAAVELVGLMLLFVPASLICMLVAFSLSRPGLAGAFYDSVWVFALAYGLRFFYVPWKAGTLALSFEGRSHDDAARMMGLSPLTRIKLSFLGTMRGAASLAWLIVFALALGELEIATFLAQPGRQPVSVYLDNMMHYGRSSAVIQWSFILLATEAAVAFLVLAAGSRQWRKLHVSA
ncbi:MAG: hypothetical protein V2A58_04165 [Planctomycetota bacterium]